MVVVVVVRARLLVCWCVECMALTQAVHAENVLPVIDKVEEEPPYIPPP